MSNDPIYPHYRATDGDAFRTSGQDYDRGYTGHEQLDDSGLIHMNGRLYDPELGRMLSPDPYVQVPEYSQNFNRYSYVMNNPLNLTDPTGFSWLGDAFHDVGGWLKENWRTVAVIAVGAFLMFNPIGQAFLGSIVSGLYTGITGAASIAGMSGGLYVAGMAAVSGSIMGGLNSAVNGGALGDVLRGAVVGGIQGAITGSILHGWGEAAGEAGFFSQETALHVAGHGVVGGAANAAMGGKFQDGFISGAVSAAAADAGAYGFIKGGGAGAKLGRSLAAGIVGGTASALGGGKFANGAWTAAFQHLLNREIEVALDGQKSPTELKKDQEDWTIAKGRIKSEILADGRLTRSEANYWYRIGNGDPLTVDAAKLTIDSYSMRKITQSSRSGKTTYFAHGKDAGLNHVRGFADWEVHGKVGLRPDGTIQSEPYNFEHQPNASIFRNVATVVGGFSAGNGKLFMIHFTGKPTINFIK